MSSRLTTLATPNGPPYFDWRTQVISDRLAPRPIDVMSGRKLIKTYGDHWSIGRALGDLLEQCRQEIHQANDLTVWKGPYLIAVIEQKSGGGPVLTRMDLE